MDYKLTVTFDDPTADRQAIGDAIFADHGDDFDAGLGDFLVSVEDNEVVIIAKDVAKGDMTTLRDDIANEYDPVTFRLARFEHGGWFGDDLDDEE